MDQHFCYIFQTANLNDFIFNSASSASRLFYTRRRWREIDGTYDGNKLESFEVDHAKIAEYYFKHFHNGEIWMLRMDNRPSVIYQIWPKLAEIFKGKKGIVHKTNRVIDVGLYAGVGGVGIIGEYIKNDCI